MERKGNHAEQRNPYLPISNKIQKISYHEEKVNSVSPPWACQLQAPQLTTLALYCGKIMSFLLVKVWWLILRYSMEKSF